MNSSEQKIMDAFKPFINGAQAFVDEHIVGNTTMTVKEITSGFMTATGLGGAISPANFDKGFRLAIREGLITGLEGAHSRGYKRAGTVLSRTVVLSPADWEKICNKLHIPLDSKLDDVLAAIQSLIDAGLGFEIAMSK
jgi:hypothetical protein